MKLKKYSIILFLFALVMMASCSNENNEVSYVNKETQHQKEDISKDEDTKNREMVDTSSTEHAETDQNPSDLQQVMTETISDIHHVMEEEQKKNNWFQLEEDDPVAYAKALTHIKKPLSSFISEAYMDEATEDLLEAYTCYCDSNFLFMKDDTYAGFHITKQTTNEFEARTVTLDDGFYGTGWTNIWAFKKEQGRWKLADYDYIFADDRPLHVSFEDIAHAFYDEDGQAEHIEFVEYLKVDNQPHIVIQRDNEEYEIYNRETGVMNYTAMEQYTHHD